MLFSIELFLSSLFVVSNVFADENEGAMACLELFSIDNIGQECCESIKISEAFMSNVSACFESDDLSCDNVKCILDKIGIMKGDDIDEDATNKLIEKIIKEHPNEKDIAERVSRECLNRKFEEYPPENECPAFKFSICMYINAQIGCSKWKTTDICSKMADNAKKCKALVDI